MADPEKGIVGNKILIKRPGFYRTFQRDNETSVLYDSSSLPLLIEEIIATAALKLAITATSPAAEHIDELPDVFRSRVFLVDADKKVSSAHAAILGPIVKEFGGTYRADGGLRFPESIPPEVTKSLIPLVPTLYDFLLGVEYKLQIDIDLLRLRAAVESLRRVCRDPSAKINLAEVEGVLATYHPTSVPSLVLTSQATKTYMRTFKTFVEDTTYQQLSHNAGLLGVPADGQHNLDLIRRKAAELLEKPGFSALATIGSRLISLAAKLPIPLKGIVEALASPSYLPPVMPFQDAYAKAEKEWHKTLAPVETVVRAENLLRDGWREIADAPQPHNDYFQAMPESSSFVL